MFQSIWHLTRSIYTQRRSGIDTANIEHVRADLRFRLAMVEYVYFGRSGRRVTRCLKELKSLLGEKGMHRYLRTLDPDLRTQFVERFQGVRREADNRDDYLPAQPKGEPVPRSPQSARPFSMSQPASNVVPIGYASRKTGSADDGEPREPDHPHKGDSRSVDFSD